ncbi:MAG: hypothetical protein ACLTL6_08990 [Holdemanella porci]
MKKNNDIQEWLRLYDTSVIPENKMNELISAGKNTWIVLNLIKILYKIFC